MWRVAWNVKFKKSCDQLAGPILPYLRISCTQRTSLDYVSVRRIVESEVEPALTGVKQVVTNSDAEETDDFLNIIFIPEY